jgi:hypothetical protein
MWDKVLKHLVKYPSAVLTGIDGEGYPTSVRCSPEADSGRKVLKLNLPGYVTLQAGPASVLCHYHDDLLWNQTNFVLRGNLDKVDNEWVFTPTQFIEGAGAGMNPLRQIRQGRSAAKSYLAKRSVARPKVPWDKLKALYEKAQKG